MFVEQPMWDAMSSWLTPTTLFVLLNFMIAAIFLTSGFSSHASQPHSQSQQTEPILLQRSPSVLQRLKSINLYQYAHYYMPVDPSQTTSFHADDEADDRFDHFEEEEEESDRGEKSVGEVFSNLHAEKGSNVVRTKSDTEPASGSVPVKLAKKMKKSASSKSAFRHFSEAELLEARRPATAREVKTAVAVEEDEEVDVKADDFINKFKQQLKLQRLDSILRYREMLGRGAGM